MNKLFKKKSTIFFTVAFFFFAVSFFKIVSVNSQVRFISTRVLPNTYIDDYELSEISIGDLEAKLDEIEKEATDKVIYLYANENKYEYKLSELGIGINKEEVINNIKEYSLSADYWDLYNGYSNDSFDKSTFDYKYVVDEDKLIEVLESLKVRVDIEPQRGKLVVSEDKQLYHINENMGYSLDIEISKDIIKNNFETKDYNENLSLCMTEIRDSDETLNLINTRISSVTTTFDDTVDRKYNLIAGAKYINGTIVEPGEEFSFYDHVGPYNRDGFVYYLGLMGNGVCQVATTLYDAELLAGLETITRYPHGKKSVYVDGGLDATVSTDGASITDFSFRNTLDYPIYISAYTEGGNLTVEIWSYENATDGKTYELESVRYGYGSYEALRHTYQNGEYIETESLGNSYYFSE